MSKIAFTDIDGTLIRDYACVDFVAYLLSKGDLDCKYYRKCHDLMGRFQNNEINYEDWVNKSIVMWGEMIEGKEENMINERSKEFFENIKCKIFPYSRELVKYLHHNGYKVIGIGAGPAEVIEPIGKYLELDAFSGTVSETENGLYTGKIKSTIHNNGGKTGIVESMLTDNVEKSIGIGDTIHDRPLLESVDVPIALNPKDGLKKVCYEMGWNVATDKDIMHRIKKLI